jgi:hypothetical protein
MAAFPAEFIQKRAPGISKILWILIVLVLLSGVYGGIHRGLNNRPNWGSLARESTYVWEHHASQPGTSMFGYLPTTVFALWPFMVWPPQPLGLWLYVTANLLAALASLWIVHRWWIHPGTRFGLYAVPVFLACANFQHTIQANQLTLWTLLLCVGGLAAVGQGRSLVGGALLGLAGLIKVLPFFLLGFLVLRRKWAALFGVILAVLVFDLLPCLLFFGWEGTVREHRAWLRRAEWHSSDRQIEDPLLIGVYRHTSNFSYAGVLTRWLRGMPEAHTMVVLAGAPPPHVEDSVKEELDPGKVLVRAPLPPLEKPYDVIRRSLDHVPRFALARLSAPTVRWIWGGSLALGLVALAFATWRTGRRQDGRDWAPAGALWILAIFFVSPMTRHYYLALCFPALVIVWQALLAEKRAQEGRWSPGACLAGCALAAWFVGVLCLGWDLVRWYGLHLAVVAVLIAATVWAWRLQLLKNSDAS